MRVSNESEERASQAVLPSAPNSKDVISYEDRDHLLYSDEVAVLGDVCKVMGTSVLHPSVGHVNFRNRVGRHPSAVLSDT